MRGLEGHFIGQCPTVDEYVKAGKAARDADGKVVTANGRFIPRGTPGQSMKARLDSWLARNKTNITSSNLVETMFVEGSFMGEEVEEDQEDWAARPERRHQSKGVSKNRLCRLVTSHDEEIDE